MRLGQWAAGILAPTAGVIGWLATAAALGAAAPESKVIFPEDIDSWRAAIVVGCPGNYELIQGPALEGGLAGRRDTGPGHIAIDSRGNLYAACGTFIQVVTAEGSARILAGTPGLAGHADGPAWKAAFADARDIAMPDDDTMYVADDINCALRRLDRRADGWHVTTAAGVPGRRGHRDGPADQALFDASFDSVAVSDSGVVYTMDGDWLRRLEKGVVTTLNAGTGSDNGPLARAGFRRAMSQGACLSFGDGNQLYVADRWNMAIRRVDLDKGEVSTFAGAEPGAPKGSPRDGPALEARFHGGGGPYQVVCVRRGGFVLAKSADEDTLRIVKDGRMMTFGFVGGDRSKDWEGPIRSLHGGYVTPVYADRDGSVYVANNTRGGQVIRKVTRGEDRPK